MVLVIRFSISWCFGGSGGPPSLGVSSFFEEFEEEDGFSYLARHSLRLLISVSRLSSFLSRCALLRLERFRLLFLCDSVVLLLLDSKSR